MTDVGVRELKQRLSEHLDRAERGARSAFLEDLGVLSIVELDEVTCEMAAAIAEVTGARTLDALHLAAAQRVGGAAVPFLTFDLLQAQAAHGLGLTVVGA